jgi:hypothetical protein
MISLMIRRASDNIDMGIAHQLTFGLHIHTQIQHPTPRPLRLRHEISGLPLE